MCRDDYLFFDNNILFYFSSILGIIFIIILSLENRNNLILFLLILFGFNYSYIMQKYFEPLFIFIFFLMLSSKIPSTFLENQKNLFYLYVYMFIYLMSAIINDIFQITKTI